MKRYLSGALSLLMCLFMLASSLPLFAFAENGLLTVDSDSSVSNVSNPFLDVTSGGVYGGISLSEDYGSDSLYVSLISRETDRFVIRLNGNTLTLGLLALNMDLEIVGEGTVAVDGGIVIYSGELSLGSGVRLETDAELAVIAHGSDARIRLSDGVCVIGSENTVAEFAVRYEYKEQPIVFDSFPKNMTGDADGGVRGIDYYRVLYENCVGEMPGVSTARVAQFPTKEDAAAALERGIVKLVNPLDGVGNDSEDDDSFFKVSGNTLAIGKSGAILSHANLSLDGSISVNLYFELSGLEEDVDSLGALIYSGVGAGGSIPVPEMGTDGKYKFTVPISPMDMGKNINIRFEGDKSGKNWDYSVAKYARYILADTEGVFNSALKDLIASLLNYGAAVQRFVGETEQPADAVLSEFDAYTVGIADKIRGAVDRLNASDVAHGDSYYRDKASGPIAFDGIGLAVNDVTAIRICLATGYSTDTRYTYYLSYNETAESGSLYEKTVRLSSEVIREQGYVQISGISSGDFDNAFRITVKDTATGDTVAFCEMNVFYYAQGLYELSKEGSVERALAEAIIWYGSCSEAYFG